MSKHENSERCDFCRVGHVVKRKEQITFRQSTDKGYVSCRVLIPIGVCNHCGSRNWGERAEAIIEQAVRKEYDKLPGNRRAASDEMASRLKSRRP